MVRALNLHFKQGFFLVSLAFSLNANGRRNEAAER